MKTSKYKPGDLIKTKLFGGPFSPGQRFFTVDGFTESKHHMQRNLRSTLILNEELGLILKVLGSAGVDGNEHYYAVMFGSKIVSMNDSYIECKINHK